MVASSSLWSLALLASASLVAGHGAIVRAVGDAGGQGSAIGIDPATPRDGTRRTPFQQDSTRFQGQAADACGETLGGGDNDIQTGVSQIMAQSGATLPQVSDGGQLMMTLHQVNGDGAGPYSCGIDTTATGASWTTIQVTQNVAGQNGRERDGAETDHPLNVQIPAGTTCSGTAGGQTGVCMVRCENPANAGPFGGCVPFQMAGAGAAGNTTAAAAPAAAGATAATPATAAAAARKLKLRSAKMARGLLVKKEKRAVGDEDDYEFWSKKH